MEKNGSVRKFVGLHEINGVNEYNEFTRRVEECKEFIKELQERAFQERKTGTEVETGDGLEVCAFRKDPSPMFIGMIQLVKQLISRNLDEAYYLVKQRRDNFYNYPNQDPFIPEINEDEILL